MENDPRAYELLAALLTYPGDRYIAIADECRELLESTSREAARHVRAFADRLRSLDTDELQELFTITFDLNPVCSLDVGWHLHGDTYDRGELLVRMRELLRRTGVVESAELPDHLSHLLAALPRLESAERSALITTIVMPALEKMVPALADRGNPFERLLNAVQCVLLTEVASSTRVPAATRRPDGEARS